MNADVPQTNACHGPYRRRNVHVESVRSAPRKKHIPLGRLSMVKMKGLGVSQEKDACPTEIEVRENSNGKIAYLGYFSFR